MKKLLLFVAGLFAFIGFASTAYAAPTLTVTSPNGGEMLTVGQTATITWSSTNVDTVYIGWSEGVGSLNWIATNIPNTGSYSWTVNVGNTSKTQFKIQVMGYLTGSGSVTDLSDNFFTVTKAVANPPTITSTNARVAGSFEMYADGQATVIGTGLVSGSSVIISGIQANVTATRGDGTALAINVPSMLLAGQTYPLYITNGNGTSNTIQIKILSLPASTITVTSPNGGEILRAGDKKMITWTSSGISGDVTILLCDAIVTSSCGEITLGQNGYTGVPNSGSFDWTVKLSSQEARRVIVLIRGYTALGSIFQDTSDGSFTIDPTSATPLPSTIASISPASVSPGGRITIYGAHFTGATSVTLTNNSVAGGMDYPTEFSPVNDAQMGVPLPSTLTPGQYSVTIKTPSGQTTSTATFTYAIPTTPTTSVPVITVVGPAPTSSRVGDTVPVYGSGFTTASYVEVVDVGMSISPIFYTDTLLKFVVPSGLSVGMHTIRIKEKASEVTSNTKSFVVQGQDLIPTNPPSIACTQEAKQCSNGSYVSRTGPSCEFAACPPPTVPTPTPTPTPVLPVVGDVDTSGALSCTTLSVDLRYRSRDISSNNQVTDLQDFLSMKGYLNGEPTGFFGLQTLSAVKTFQSARGIEATGFVGPITRAKINAMCNSTATNSGTGSSSVPTSPVAGGTNALQDQISALLKQIQMLQQQLKSTQPTPAPTTPTISSASPSVGTTNTVVTIYGTNLTGATTVEFYNSGNQLVGNLALSSVAPEGTSVQFILDGRLVINTGEGVYQISIVTPGSGGVNTNKIPFSITLKG